MLTEEQLEARKAGIGGSDAAAVLGLSPWKSPLDVYRQKVGEVEKEELANAEAVHFGNVLEATVADETARRLGVGVRRSNVMHVSSEHDFMLANIDRNIVGEPFKKRAGLECKTVDRFAATSDKWGKGAEFFKTSDGFLEVVNPDDLVPDYYLIQVMCYMAVLNYPAWLLSALVGGNDFRMFYFERDREAEDAMVSVLSDFWHNNVLAGVPPEPINLRDIESLWPSDDGGSIYAPPAVLEVYSELKEKVAELKALETRIDGSKVGNTRVGGLKNALRMAFKENAEILLDGEGKPIATWKQTKGRKVFDEAAFKADDPLTHKKYLIDRPGPRMLLLKGA